MPPKITSSSSPPPTPAESIADRDDTSPRRLPVANVNQFTQPPPSPPPTNSLAPTITEHDEDTVVGADAAPPAPPPRAPPPVPQEAAPTVKVSSAPSIPVFSETPASSTVSAFLHSQFTHRDLESLQARPVAQETQLDRRATTGNQRTLPTPMVAVPPAPASVSFGEIISRPTTSAPSVSLKEVGKVGSHIGKNPVDYLKPNGSLPAPVSPYFHPTHDPGSLDPPPDEGHECEGIFGNLNFLLESYLAILSSGGSIAVGTGYRSVARRLLERVEGMFARDLGVPGVGWADVLEHIRGERSKPPLCIIPVRGLLSRKEEEKTELSGGGGEEPVDTKDLAESVVAGIKTKPAMGKVAEWLEQVGAVLREEEEGNRAVAEKAAITQEQEEEEDRIVCEIIEGILIKNTEESQCQQFREYLESSSLIASTRLALSRLYPENTLESITPPIAALYLLLHPDLHPLLLAIANVSKPELDLINSGRFDAFLDGASNVVARDEEEELATITALDKRLWSVLEGLENQIEDLHTRALVVRRALKSRKELIGKKHKHLAPERSPTSRSASPVQKMLQLPETEKQEDEDDWARNVPTLHLPITPDDSASNIASNRRRRKERASALDDSGSRSKSKREKSSRLKKVDEEKSGFSPQRISVREYGGTILDAESEMGETGVSRRRRKKEKEGSSSRVRSRSKSRHRGGEKERKHHHHSHREDKEAEKTEKEKTKVRPS